MSVRFINGKCTSEEGKRRAAIKREIEVQEKWEEMKRKEEQARQERAEKKRREKERNDEITRLKRECEYLKSEKIRLEREEKKREEDAELEKVRNYYEMKRLAKKYCEED